MSGMIDRVEWVGVVWRRVGVGLMGWGSEERERARAEG